MEPNACYSFRVDPSVAKRQEVRMAYTFALVIGTFIICWTPVTINFLVVAITKNRQYFQDHGLLNFFHVFSVCATHFNSAIDPIIYAYRIKDVRDTMKNLFRGNQDDDISTNDG